MEIALNLYTLKEFKILTNLVNVKFLYSISQVKRYIFIFNFKFTKVKH